MSGQKGAVQIVDFKHLKFVVTTEPNMYIMLVIRIDSSEEMELIIEKIPESIKKRMTDEEKMLKKEESSFLKEREATELWRLRQLQQTEEVRKSRGTRRSLASH